MAKKPEISQVEGEDNAGWESGRYTSRGLPKLEPTRRSSTRGVFDRRGCYWASAATAPPNTEKEDEMAGVTRVRLATRMRSLAARQAWERGYSSRLSAFLVGSYLVSKSRTLRPLELNHPCLGACPEVKRLKTGTRRVPRNLVPTPWVAPELALTP